MFPCPCCGNRTLSEEPPGSFEVCPVCYWEDDFAQAEDADLSGGANEVSLSQARDNYARIGASAPEHVGRVRAPTSAELPARGG
jgi:hypothetical protein